MPRRRFRLLAIAAITAIAVAIAGCAASTFDPATPCTEDGRFPGAYPALEEALPPQHAGRPPDSRDSGRNCEPGSLGTLARHGVDELRYAGSIWDLSAGAAVSHALLEADGLDPAWVAEFYEEGARAGRRVEEVTVSEVALGDVEGTRIDALNGESYQTVVVGPADTDEDHVRVVIVANPVRQIQTRDAHDRVVAAALVSAFEGSCCN